MPSKYKKNSGYSLIEVVVVLAFFSIIIHLVFTNLMGFGQNKILDQSANEAVVLLEEMQQKASHGHSSGGELQSCGVMVLPDGITQFFTPSDYANRIVVLDYTYHWPDNITSVNVSLPDDCQLSNDCIIFSKGTGLADSGGQFNLQDNNTDQINTITIESSGLVEKH